MRSVKEKLYTRNTKGLQLWQGQISISILSMTTLAVRLAANYCHLLSVTFDPEDNNCSICWNVGMISKWTQIKPSIKLMPLCCIKSKRQHDHPHWTLRIKKICARTYEIIFHCSIRFGVYGIHSQLTLRPQTAIVGLHIVWSKMLWLSITFRTLSEE